MRRKILVSLLIISLILPIIAVATSSQLALAQNVSKATTVKITTSSIEDKYAIDFSFRLLRPRITMAAIFLNGDTFIIEMLAKSNTSVSDWAVQAMNETHSYNLPINHVAKVSDDKYNINVTIPTYVGSALYDLQVNATVDGTTKSALEPHALKVLYKFPATFTFVQLTDEHLRTSRTADANILLDQAIYQINMLQPDFVISSGDNVDQGTDKSFMLFREQLYALQVPLFAGPGNHDYSSNGKLDLFEKWLAYTNASFDFGQFHFVSVNVSNSWEVERYQVDWLRQDLAQHPNQTKILFFHYPMFSPYTEHLEIGKAGGYLLQTINEFKVPYVLTGHLHTDYVTVKNGTTYIITTTLGSGHPAWDWNGYRIFHVINNNITWFGYANNLTRSYPVRDFKVVWHPSPAFTDAGARLTITNNWVDNFSSLTIKLKLTPLASGYYQIENASLIENATYPSLTYFMLNTSIKSGETKTIRVYPNNSQAPTISSINVPETLEVIEPILITVKVSNPVSGIDSVEIHYQEEGKPWKTKTMLYRGDNEYGYSFTGFTRQENVTVYFTAYDYSGLHTDTQHYIIHVINKKEEQAGIPVSIVTIGLAIGAIAVVAVVATFFIKKKKA